MVICIVPIIARTLTNLLLKCRFSSFYHIRCLNLDEMTAGLLFSSRVLLLRSGSQQKNMIKMPVFSLIQPAQCFEGSFKLMFQKNVTTTAQIARKEIPMITLFSSRKKTIKICFRDKKFIFMKLSFQKKEKNVFPFCENC